MVGAGVGADLEHPVYIQKEDFGGPSGHHVHHQGLPGGAGVGLGENLPRLHTVQYRGVAPEVVVFDEDAAREHDAQRGNHVAGAVDPIPLGIPPPLRPQAGEHGRHLLRLSAQKEGRARQGVAFHMRLLSWSKRCAAGLPFRITLCHRRRKVKRQYFAK